MNAPLNSITRKSASQSAAMWIWMTCLAASTAGIFAAVGQTTSSSQSHSLPPAPARPPATLTVVPPPGAPQIRTLSSPTPTVLPAKPLAMPTTDKFKARAASLEERAKLRAYEGAPPVVPHPTFDLKVQTCRACHAQGLKAGDQTARMVSHTYLTNCVQCHVEAENAGVSQVTFATGNSFDGYRPAGFGGDRWGAGAPPTIPHTTFMRTNCVSCHGEYGYEGWKPDHLSRSNCIQCHAPGSELDQLSPSFSKSVPLLGAASSNR